MTQPSTLIAIAGGSGAGKSHLAARIATELGAAATVLPLDDYFEDQSHLAPDELAAVNFDHPDAYDRELFRDHLRALLGGDPVDKPVYDHVPASRRDERVRVEPSELLVVEGLYALRFEEVRTAADLGIYVETDADVRLARRLRQFVVEGGRDLQPVLDQWLSDVKPMHEEYVRETRAHADLVFRGGETGNVVDFIRRTV